MKRGGHETVRLFVRDTSNVRMIMQPLRDLGCTARADPIERLFAMDVPPHVSYEAVVQILGDGERRGVWDYEESSIEADDG